jgi:Bacterial PH domain
VDVRAGEGAVDGETPADQVAGTYRVERSGLAWAWTAFAVLSALQTVLNAVEGRVVLAVINTFAVMCGVMIVAGYRSERTVVSPEGIRVRSGWRWRTISWDEVREVAAPDRWTSDRTLRVTTTEGKDIALHVPGRLREALIAYAEEHRSSARGTA